MIDIQIELALKYLNGPFFARHLEQTNKKSKFVKLYTFQAFFYKGAHIDP